MLYTIVEGPSASELEDEVQKHISICYKPWGSLVVLGDMKDGWILYQPMVDDED